jgi:O-antigen ligase
MAIRNPVFGVGFWGFNRNFQAYAIGGDTGSEKTNMTAHSSWVLVLAESGFMGLFLFVALWAYTAYRAWLLRNTEPEYFMSLAGYAVAISFLSHTYLLFPYILLGLVISHSKLDDVVLDYNLHTKVL